MDLRNDGREYRASVRAGSKPVARLPSNPMKQPKPKFTVEFERGAYGLKEAAALHRGLYKWTFRIRAANGKIILSSGPQLYSRRIDAVREAKKIQRAFLDGLVEIQA